MVKEHLGKSSNLARAESESGANNVRTLLENRIDTFFNAQRQSLLRTFEGREIKVKKDIEQYRKKHIEIRATINNLPDEVISLIWGENIPGRDLVDLLDRFHSECLTCSITDEAVAITTRSRHYQEEICAHSGTTLMPEILIIKAFSKPQQFSFRELRDGRSLILIARTQNKESALK